MTDSRDIEYLNRIVWYCNEIDATIAYFGDSFDVLKANTIYQHALAMCVLQLGELTTKLTDEFKIAHTDIPWGDIKKMRNIAAHKYGEFSIEFLWDTAKNDIGELREYCTKYVCEFE